MNKKVMGFLLAIPALMGVGLTSCSDESSLAVKETTQDKLVNVTLTAQVSDQTRASFDPNKEILEFKWELNDEILVVNSATGDYIGKLTVSEVRKDPRVCSFKGSLAIPAGKVKLNFFYLGKVGKASFGEGLALNDYLVDFSAQDGTVNFANHDILMTTGEFQDAQDGNLGMINFDRHFAYGRFILKYNGEALDLNGKSVTISANSGTLYNKAILNFQNAAYAFEEGNIVVSPKTNDFYVSFFPSEAVNLKFTVNEFDGTKMNSLKANIYYTANTEGDPVIVEMRHSDGSDDKQNYQLHYDPNYTATDVVSVVVELNYSTSPAVFTVKGYDLFPREDYVITSWNTKADGSGDKYEAGSTFTLEGDNYDGTLYAQWTEKEYAWTVTWKNGYNDAAIKTENYTGKTGKIDITSDYPENPVREGYTFTGWAPEVKVLTKDKLSVEIVAQWTKNNVNYKLTYHQNINGSTLTIDDIPEPTTADSWTTEVADYNNLGIFPSTTPEGYEFVEWNTKADGSGKTYKVGAEFTLTSTSPQGHLYGIFKEVKKPTVTTPGYGHGDFN